MGKKMKKKKKWAKNTIKKNSGISLSHFSKKKKKKKKKA